MTINVVFANNTYAIPETSETGWGALTNFLVALANQSASTLSMFQSVRTTTTTPTALLSTDFALLVNVNSASVVTLPTGVTKQVYCIADASGLAFTNNITINTTGGQLIDGASSYTIKSNFGAIFVIFDGTQWRIISEYVSDQKYVRNNNTNASFVDSSVSAFGAFATAANGQGCSVTFSGTNSFDFLISLDSGESIRCLTDFKSNVISAISDISNIYVNAASGTNQFAVSKSANSFVINFKNNLGSSKVVEIKSLTAKITSATAWS
jgi:hypothetical protein